MLRIHLIRPPFSAEKVAVLTDANQIDFVSACEGVKYNHQNERFKPILDNLKARGFKAELLIVE